MFTICHILVDRVGNFGDFDVVCWVCRCRLLSFFFTRVIKVCRKVPSMVSLFLNTCFSDVFIDCLEGGGKNDEKVGIAILR